MFYRYPCRSVAVCRLSQFLTKLDCEQSLSVPRNQSSGRGNTKINWRSRNWLYRKIPIIIPGAYFWSKGLFAKFFFFWGGGGLYSGGGLYMDEYLRFDNAIFCSSNCNLLTFSAHNLSLLLIFLYIFRSSVIRTVNINYRTHTVELMKYLPPNFNVMFKFNYSKYNPRGLIFGGTYTWKEFSVSKVGS